MSALKHTLFILVWFACDVPYLCVYTLTVTSSDKMADISFCLYLGDFCAKRDDGLVMDDVLLDLRVVLHRHCSKCFRPGNSFVSGDNQ